MDRIVLECHNSSTATLSHIGQGGVRSVLGELKFNRESADAFIECMSGHSSKAEFSITDINLLFLKENGGV